jgi:D-3-phosphoglycerate dehydrogenase
MPKVLIAPSQLYELDSPFMHALKRGGFDVTYPRERRQMFEPEVLEHLSGAVATIAGSEPYTRRVMEAHPQLRVIARAGVGFDAVDVAAATDRGVVVTIAPGTNQDAVAEHTFSLILAAAKNLVPQHLGTVGLKWPRSVTVPLRGRTLGIAGTGRIGKSVAVRGAAFGMRLLGYDPYPDHVFAQKHGLTYVPLEQLLAEADYLTLHLPASEASRHLICRATLARMKPTAFLFNTSRGSIINEKDLIEALENRKLAAPGLDVFEEEPPTDSPLFHMDNVVATPHAAGVDLQSRDDMALSAAEAIVSLSRGDWPAEKIVNPEVRQRFRW